MKKRLLLLLVLLQLACISTAFGQNIQLLRNLSSLLGTSQYRLMESVEMDGKLYFSTWSTKGTVLWYTDGNVTAAIYEWPLGKLGVNYALNKMYVFNNRLLFTGIDSAHGKELWVSDGTTAGTHLLKDIKPGPASGIDRSPSGYGYSSNVRYYPFEEMNGRKYFMPLDSNGSSYEIWQTDGTAAGTTRVQVFDTYPEVELSGPIGIYKDRLYFQAFHNQSSSNFGTYISDGTVSGTSELSHGLIFQDYFIYKSRLMFNSLNGRGSENFGQIDDTGISVVQQGAGCGADRVSFNNKLYYFSSGGQREFNVSDGTAAGTFIIGSYLPSVLVQSSLNRPLDITEHSLVVYNAAMYFRDRGAIRKSDGTAAGTIIVKEFAYDQNRLLLGLTAAGNGLYFKLWDSVRMALWVSDGSAVGTHEILFAGADYVISSDIYEVVRETSFPSEPIMIYKNKLIFTGIYENAVGKALYTLDLPLSATTSGGIEQRTLRAYPNPTSGQLHIRYPENDFTSANVFDALGRIVYSMNLSGRGKETLHLDHLSSGTYFLSITGKAQALVTRFVIDR